MRCLSIHTGLLFFTLGVAFAYPQPPNLSNWMAPIVKKLDQSQGISLGVSIADVKTGEYLYEASGTEPLVPASVMKVFTSYVALSELGPSFQFNTQLKAISTQTGETMEGKFYLIGSGDPLLVNERMWLFANSIARLGVKKFQGPLILDTTLFQEMESVEERRIDSAVERPYNAVLSPLSFNFNTATIAVRPSVDGKKALVALEPRNSYIKTINKVKIVSGSKAQLDARLISKEGEAETYEVTGTLGEEASEKKLYRTVKRPPLYFAHVLLAVLKEVGVEWVGDITPNGKTPSEAKTLVSFESLPLSQMIDGLNKYSNNFLADQIMLALAGQKGHRPATFESSRSIMLRSLAKIGINVDGMKIENGSGLSHQIRVTPHQITAVLLEGTRNLNWGPYFMSSFSTNGIDGTLKDRLRGSRYDGRLKGKTGSIRGVASLAGYVHTTGGRILAVTSLMNDPQKHLGDLRDQQDEFFKRLIDWQN